MFFYPIYVRFYHCTAYAVYFRCLRVRLLRVSGVTSHRQPRQCRGGQGSKTVKGAQSEPNYVMYQDCY